MNRQLSFATFLVLAVVPALGFAQQAREESPKPLRGDLPEHLQQFKARGLPPVGERVEFENLETVPPTLKGLSVNSDFRLDIKPTNRQSVREARSSMREMALADPRVRKSLGTRFSLLGSGWLDAEKSESADVPSERYRLVFYNYERNAAVNVVVEKNKIVDVGEAKQGYQPAESHEEVEAAAELVKKDDRFRALVDGLVARGIQTPGKKNSRHLYVTFHKEKRSPALVEAEVDMTAGRVVAARRLQP